MLSIDKLEGQAKYSIVANREDLARLALERKNALVQQVDGIDKEVAELEKQEEKLIASEKRLSIKVEIFRTRKEFIKAEYSAAEAQVKINESVTGISEEMADVGLVLDKAENKKEEMKGRTEAIDELVEVGILEDFTVGSKDDIDRELSKISKKSNVKSKLSMLKAEVIKGQTKTGDKKTDTEELKEL